MSGLAWGDGLTSLVLLVPLVLLVGYLQISHSKESAEAFEDHPVPPHIEPQLMPQNLESPE